ncbi:MAG TPA: siderophore-interacting protein [Xanthobacteraceae bacterium]|nr:siderophore-interacting protein [Xanthobacteraceae bacterium]
MTDTLSTLDDSRTPRRVRHDTRRRLLTVQKVDHLTPRMVRITLTGDLDGFTSLGFDDHVKLIFPLPGESRPVVPESAGAPVPEGLMPSPMRDFTPRHYDAKANTLEIDFALHDAGPATDWAARAKPGDLLGVGGPRGSFVIPTNFDWHLLIGDETALPAISRRLMELPAGSRAVVIGEVDGPDDRLTFESSATVEVHWAYRNGAEPGTGDALAKALKGVTPPNGDYYAWVACESQVAKSLRQILISDFAANPKWTKAAGYWRRGATAIHEKHED